LLITATNLRGWQNIFSMPLGMTEPFSHLSGSDHNSMTEPFGHAAVIIVPET
jgi:hypothetical protein